MKKPPASAVMEWSGSISSSSPDELSIDFGSQGNGEAFLRGGWSQPETGETWAIDGTSQLAIPAPEHPATYILILRLRPHIVPGVLPSQRLRIFVNDTEIAQFTLTHPASRACRIPWSVIEGRRNIDIRCEMPDRARPAALGATTDQRVLGVAFCALRLFPSIVSPPAKMPTISPWPAGCISAAPPAKR